jgi:hypothetical protein
MLREAYDQALLQVKRCQTKPFWQRAQTAQNSCTESAKLRLFRELGAARLLGIKTGYLEIPRGPAESQKPD